MPAYVYKTREASNCACAWPGYVCVQKFADDPLTECPKCGSAVYRSIQSVRLNVRKLKRDVHHSHDYREDLARFPNDPEARVDGPRALRKLMDKRKREGWTMERDLTDCHDGFGSSATGEIGAAGDDKIMNEAYEAARAEGFSLDTPTVKAFLDDQDDD